MNKPSEIAAERRAVLARLSLCLSSAIIVAALFAASAAQAAPPTPGLTATNPLSSESDPASSTALRIVGEAEPGEEDGSGHPHAVTLSALGPGFLTGAATSHPQYEIEIFGEPDCKGGPVVTGLAEALEGSGIAAIVVENSVTTFSAKQVDPGESGNPSGCSNPLTYWEGDPPSREEPAGGGPGSPPESSKPLLGMNAGASRPDAPRLHTIPGGRSNDETPLVAGSAPGATAVKVFADPGCNGSPVARGSAAEFVSGLRVRVADNATTSFSATSFAAGESVCSSPVTYVEDSTPPRTRITMGPGVKTRKRKAVFRFTDTTEDPPGTNFLCKVDRGRWKQCSSPLRLRHLRFARYTVQVRAVDVAGNAETAGAKRRFKVIRRG
jgi:hypothetical protein